VHESYERTDPLVMRLVDVLIESGVVLIAMDEVDQEVGKYEEPGAAASIQSQYAQYAVP
jgi:hypothetical protein